MTANNRRNRHISNIVIKVRLNYVTRVPRNLEIGYLIKFNTELYPKYINTHEMHFDIYDVFYSQCFHQHVSAGIPAIFREIIIITRIQNVRMCSTASPSLHNN